MQGRPSQVVAGLLEREHELQRLEASVCAAADGLGCIVAIEGEAGIGKSSLLAHATGCARASEMRILAARGGELEREFPFGVVRQLFEAPLSAARPADRARLVAGAAGLALPVLEGSARRSRSETDPSSILHGLYWLAANLALEQPLLICVDDAHWADQPSIGFLTYLARRADELALAIVYASRLGEGASETLPAVTEPALVRDVLRPAALSEAASVELVDGLLDQAGSPAFAQACHSATSGNPFLLRELVRALVAEDVLPVADNTDRVAQIAPRAIARATLARLRGLGPAAGDVALAVAVLGKSAELRHAAALAGIGCDEAAAIADRLASASILRDGRPLEFIHPIVRTTIYTEMPPGRRAAGHKHAARVLAQDGADAVALAPHLLATEPEGDPWIVERLRAAASDAVEGGAPDGACTYLERAVREPAPAADRPQILLELGSARLQFDAAAAIGDLQAAHAAAGDPSGRLASAWKLVAALSYVGRVAEAIELGTDTLAELTPEDAETALRLEGDLAAMAQFAPGFAKPALAQLARHEGRLRGDTPGERLVLACLAFGSAHRGESAAATAQLARLALAEGRLLHDHRSGTPNFYLAVWGLIYAGFLDEAAGYLDFATESARRRGSQTDFGAVCGSRCHVLVQQGRLVEAECEALGVLPLVALHAISRGLVLSCALRTMIERADPRTWQPFRAEHGIDGDLWETAMGGMLLFARGQQRLAAGDPRGALDDLDTLRRRDATSGMETPAIPARGWQALAHLQLGARETAQSLAAEELARARRWGSPSSIAFALRTAGLVEGGAAGIDLLRASAALITTADSPYERAQSVTALGAALRRAGHRRDAREPLREGLDLAVRCGALRLAGLVRDELVAAGGRPRRTALSGRDALTPSERRVAQLAADGMTNREIAQALFVTARTVEGHLTQTYAKLGVGSREQLGAALAAPCA